MSHVFKHPKYYKKLKASQEKKAISPDPATAEEGRTPQATSFKRQAIDETVPHCDIEEAASSKPQAPSLDKNEAQASSPKQQGSSVKP
jgi:hypothetical protein